MVERRVYPFVLALLALPNAVVGFDFAHVRDQALALSAQPFRAATNQVPAALLNLSYEQDQSIHFERARALWARERLPFQLEFFLPGSAHRQTVRIHEVTDREVRRVPFSAESFSLGTNRLDLPPWLDYAGFRIVHPPEGFGEIAAFLGASYFRMIGRGQAFGASARGLALNTSLQKQEEFPAFREFWVRKPGQGDKAITVWALLDSASVAGAFEFLITPGAATSTEVKAAFFPRREIKEFGVAPLTSMFLYDQNSHPPWTDFRPNVHDSDGLLLETGSGQVFWRPLESGKMMRINGYQDVNPKGFGLLQRERNFELFQDLAARFDLRPSVWVRPKGEWGPGQVELIQLPSDIEYADNVVAFWVPAKPPAPGQPVEMSYQLQWLTNEISPSVLGHVHSTRMGRVPTSSTSGKPNLRFVIDFDGQAVTALSKEEQLDAEVHCGEGARFVADTVLKNEVNQTWRLVVEITAPSKAVDLQARLMHRDKPITETWTYTWQP